MQNSIFIKGARENNLKNIDVEIPRNKLVVFTGLSGSGKSSLAFDTIYAEGQRRYVESLSSYARMFLGQMDKPDVDYIDGLSPAISIDQKTTSKNPRSTVGTVTEIYDYLRLLWARIGIPHCPKCGREIHQQSIDQIVDRLMSLPEGTRIQILAPVIRGKKGEHVKVLEDARRSGYVRARIDGNLYDLSETISLAKNNKHNIEIVIDRLVIKPEVVRRLTDSAETALALSGGLLYIDLPAEERQIAFSQNYACDDCGISIEELAPRLFSFNNPAGACPTCTGLGTQMLIDPELIMPNPNLSILDGGITASGWGNVKGDSISRMYFDALSRRFHFKLSDPIRSLPKEAMDAILYGTKGEPLQLHYERNEGFGVIKREFEGIVNNLERRYRETQSPAMRADIEECMSETPCPSCRGRRLKPTALAVTVGGMDIATFTDLSVVKALAFIDGLRLSDKDRMIAQQILKEIRSRLGFLQSVGLGYLTLSRTAATLSGGESQRIRLATQIGSSLMGVLYILDEPSIGLHQRDNAKLLKTLKQLRDLGNTLIVVEHDEETMREADHVIDIGPGAGVNGGRVVCAGSVEEICACEESVTGQYLSGKKRIPLPETRREGNGRSIWIRGAQENNLKNIDVEIPLGKLICVTGVSGSGKSSLINEVLYKTLASEKNRSKVRPGRCGRIEGLEHVEAPGLRSGALLLQRQGRALRSLLGRRPAEDRDAFPAGRICALRRLRRQALQPRNAGGPVQGQEHRRRAGYDRGGSLRLLPEPAEDPDKDPDALRRGTRLREAGAVQHHALRRRGAAREACDRAVEAQHRQHGLRAGRADHGPAYRGRPRPRPRGRRRRRRAGLCRHAGGLRAVRSELYRTISEDNAPVKE